MPYSMKRKQANAISFLGECALIERLTRRLPLDSSVVHGAGDDCAVLKKGKTRYKLLTTDMSVEDIHFTVKKIKPEAVGYKALARNISDIAAMGGMPRYAVIALGLPAKCSVAFVDKIFKGIRQCASLFSVYIVGGDVSQSKKIIIAISVIGEVKKKNCVTRSGARIGDIVFVTGTLGGSRVRKHCTFMPRVHEARFLTETGTITSMIDLSDGMVQDLNHILTMSGVGCVLNLENIPLSRDALTIAHHDRHKALTHALTDGEDFELLFTVSPRSAVTLQKKWQRRFSIPITPVGTIIKGKNIVYQKGTYRNVFIKKKGYTHF